MRAIVLRGPYKIGIEEVPAPEPKGDLIVASVRAVGICGTDLEIYSGKHPITRKLFEEGTLKRLILGHEWAGEVVETGDHIEAVAVGDRITSETTIPCGKCFFCSIGRPNLCDHAQEIGITRDGAMANYIAIPANIIHKLPKKLSFEEGALIEPTAIAVHAMDRLAEVDDVGGKLVAIFGDGTIGLLILQLVLKREPKRVVLFGKSDYKLRIAEELGDVECINTNVRSKAEVFKRIKEALAPRGADIVIEAAPSCSVIEEVLLAVKKGGTVLVVGLHDVCPVDVNAILFKELHILSSLSSPGVWDRAIDMVVRNEINVRALISRIVSLKEGVEIIRSRGVSNAVKTLIRP